MRGRSPLMSQPTDNGASPEGKRHGSPTHGEQENNGLPIKEPKVGYNISPVVNFYLLYFLMMPEKKINQYGNVKDIMANRFRFQELCLYQN